MSFQSRDYQKCSIILHINKKKELFEYINREYTYYFFKIPSNFSPNTQRRPHGLHPPPYRGYTPPF